MSVIEQAMVISAIYIVLYIVLIVQGIGLARWHKAESYYLHAIGWLMLGIIRLWNFYKLPANWIKLRDQGWTPPTYLDAETYTLWVLGVVALILFIVGYHRRRVALQDLSEG